MRIVKLGIGDTSANPYLTNFYIIKLAFYVTAVQEA